MNRTQKVILIVYALLVLAAGLFPLHDYIDHRASFHRLVGRTIVPIWEDPRGINWDSGFPEQNTFLGPFFVTAATLAAVALVFAFKGGNPPR